MDMPIRNSFSVTTLLPLFLKNAAAQSIGSSVTSSSWSQPLYFLFTPSSGEAVNLQNLYNHHPNTQRCPEGESMKYTRFEKARIIGARALQISYGAPVLTEYPENMIDPIDVALLEYEEDLIPITVVRD
ncbi:MAG: DNA-directed RNA polymerase subunit K, partial [Candidatus Methanomethylophilaceae archaeon]